VRLLRDMWKEQYPNVCVVLAKSSPLYLAWAAKVPRVMRCNHWGGGSRMLVRGLLVCSRSKIHPKYRIMFLLSCPVIMLQTKYERFNWMIIWWNKIVHILNHSYNMWLLTLSALVTMLSSIFKTHEPTTRWCWSRTSDVRDVGSQWADRSKITTHKISFSRH